jgi:hypothetical protein
MASFMGDEISVLYPDDKKPVILFCGMFLYPLQVYDHIFKQLLLYSTSILVSQFSEVLLPAAWMWQNADLAHRMH